MNLRIRSNRMTLAFLFSVFISAGALGAQGSNPCGYCENWLEGEWDLTHYFDGACFLDTDGEQNCHSGTGTESCVRSSHGHIACGSSFFAALSQHLERVTAPSGTSVTPDNALNVLAARIKSGDLSLLESTLVKFAEHIRYNPGRNAIQVTSPCGSGVTAHISLPFELAFTDLTGALRRSSH